MQNTAVKVKFLFPSLGSSADNYTWPLELGGDFLLKQFIQQTPTPWKKKERLHSVCQQTPEEKWAFKEKCNYWAEAIKSFKPDV